MLKWFLIATLVIIVLLIIEEATEFFWKRYMNGPTEKTGGTWKEKAITMYQSIRTWHKDSKIITMIMQSKFVILVRKKQKDPS